MNSKLQPLLLRSLVGILYQGINLLGEINDFQYSGARNNAISDGGAVGGHFRHCLEFINCFLADADSGKIDYEKRERNQLLETGREFAIAEYARTIGQLENFRLNSAEKVLLVKTEILTDKEDLWCESSVERELEFLQSHTIHHYALIAFKLRAKNFSVSKEFGVAPSTLRFWNIQNEETLTKKL